MASGRSVFAKAGSFAIESAKKKSFGHTDKVQIFLASLGFLNNHFRTGKALHKATSSAAVSGASISL